MFTSSNFVPSGEVANNCASVSDLVRERERKREGEREGERERERGGREGEREGGREETEREYHIIMIITCSLTLLPVVEEAVREGKEWEGLYRPSSSPSSPATVYTFR